MMTLSDLTKPTPRGEVGRKDACRVGVKEDGEHRVEESAGDESTIGGVGEDLCASGGPTMA